MILDAGRAPLGAAGSFCVSDVGREMIGFISFIQQIQFIGSTGQPGEIVPENALTLNGQPLIMNGNYLVLGA
ncbi:hypothetical protein ELH77_19340 [Rhizobium ruizarguesonis]|uniref:hypothetical protein n=1 Tax=Rhizobium ruizarguesonis TaxID=2081791 RepID=UPI00103095EB|nr:hypothetical protein [Rhizobium ruizarguesonis]TAZ20761.1 hypothetical protein ELH77_19340 [Rhizobium ruizarguesonis]